MIEGVCGTATATAIAVTMQSSYIGLDSAIHIVICKLYNPIIKNQGQRIRDLLQILESQSLRPVAKNTVSKKLTNRKTNGFNMVN